MEKKFTLRLQERHTNELLKLQRIIGTSTNAKAIRFIIENFLEAKNQIEDYQKMNYKLQEENYFLKNTIKDFFRIQETLKHISDKIHQ